MRKLENLLCSIAVAGVLALGASPATAAPTSVITGGSTAVRLSPSFLTALSSLGVNPAALYPGQLQTRDDKTYAVFPVTTGEVDLGTLKAEVDHSGGLSLALAAKQVGLSDFVIDLTGSTPVLSGLVTVDGSLLTRLPLFDLDLSQAQIGMDKDQDGITVSNVGVSLTSTAANALNGVFNISALKQGVGVGTANVRAHLWDARWR